MISSGVTPLGGVFSRGPSWASAGGAGTASASKKTAKRTVRGTSLILPSLPNLEGTRRRAPPILLVSDRRTGKLCPEESIFGKYFRADAPYCRGPPPTPLRSVRPGVGAAVLPLTWMPERSRGCRREKRGWGPLLFSIGSSSLVPFRLSRDGFCIIVATVVTTIVAEGRKREFKMLALCHQCYH